MRGRPWLALGVLGLVSCRDLALPSPPDRSRPGAISGRAVTALSGRQDLAAVASARVELLGTGLVALSNAEGYFRIDGIRSTSGQLLLSVDLDGDGRPDRQKLLALDALQAGPGRSVSVGDVALVENALLRGRALLGDAAGALEHAGTLAFIPEGPFTATTSADGSFLLPALPEGTFSLQFFHAGYETTGVDALTLVGGQDLTLRSFTLPKQTSTPAARAVTGTVALSDGASAEGTVVRLQGLGVALTTTAASTGAFAFPDVPQGLYALVLTRPGYVPLVRSNLLVLDAVALAGAVLVPGEPIDAGPGPRTQDGGQAGGGAGASSGLVPRVRVTPFGPGVDPGCPRGGYRLESGLDADGNGLLDAAEVTATQALCLSPSVLIAPAPTAQCPGGGVVLTQWVDANLDGRYQAGEEVGVPAILCTTGAAPVDAGTGLDAGAGDAGSNPLGVTWGGVPGAWSFGYAVYSGDGYSMVPFDTVNDTGTLLMLQRAGYVNSGDPSVFKNEQGVTWAGVPPGGIALHPGPLANVDDAIIRFTAPAAGFYRFVGAFGAGDIGATLDRIHTAAGFQDHSDPNFAFDLAVSLAAGEQVDWMVGNAGSFIGDTTPLDLTSLVVCGGPLALATPAHQTLVLGVPFTLPLVATTVDPVTYAIHAGALPDGLHLDPGTGILSGTPTIAALLGGSPAGSYAGVVIRATTACASADTAPFTLDVTGVPLPPPSVYWSFDDAALGGQGAWVSDGTGHGYDGTLSGGVTTGAPGAVGQAFTFDGLTGLVRNALVTPPPGDYSLVVVAAPTAPDGQEHIALAYGIGAPTPYFAGTWLQVEPDGTVLGVFEDGTVDFLAAGSTVLPVGAWTPLGITWSATTRAGRLYVGGRNEASLTTSGPVRFGTTALEAGRHQQFNTRYWSGGLDEAAFFATTLDDQQMATVAWHARRGHDLATVTNLPTGALGGLRGLRWQIPCAAGASGQACAAVDPAPVVATVGGPPGASYDVTLRFRGVVEQKTYTGGTNDGAFWQVGGTAPADSYNVYALTVSSPAEVYFLNRGVSNISRCWLIDYTKTIRLAAGATVTLTAQVFDGTEIRNLDGAGSPLVVPGVPPDPSSFDGQFIQMDVVSVTAVP